MPIIDPPATAGGTDCVQVHILDFVRQGYSRQFSLSSL